MEGLPRKFSSELKTRDSRISNDLRSSAMTLHFYSAKAYQFVCNSFDGVLPHSQTIRSWYSSIHAYPGFTTASFSLKAHVEGRKDKKETVCSDDG